MGRFVYFGVPCLCRGLRSIRADVGYSGSRHDGFAHTLQVCYPLCGVLPPPSGCTVHRRWAGRLARNGSLDS